MDSGEEAFKKVAAGASLVQLYSALVFQVELNIFVSSDY